VPRESKIVLDLTEQDFQNISKVTGRIFEIGVHRSDGHVSTILSSLNSEFLNQDLKGKHSWLNASSAKDLAERVRHVLSACVLDSLSTSVCILTRQAMSIDMSLLRDFRCILTVPKGGLVRQLHEDGSWRVVRSLERSQVLYRPSAADKVSSAEACLLTCKVLAASASKYGRNKFSRMMFAGRAAAATKANILFDTGASANFVSKSFAKQTGITVRPVDYSVRLADHKTMEVAGEATVYVQLGSFHKPVKCYVMDMLYEVDLILGEAFMLKYDCILHYGKGCIMIRKGKRHMTVNSPALPRVQPPVEKENSDSVLSASQLKRKARKGARVFRAVIRPVESDPDHLWWPLSRLCLRCQPPLSNLTNRLDPQAVKYFGFPICCLSFLKCFRILCRLVCPLNVQKGTVFLQSQVILLRFGRCTVYLRWNTESWKSRSPSF
jgi:hypothetical protein